MHSLLLIVLDGFGERHESQANAVRLAKTPTLDRLRAEYPFTLLNASGTAVGLPPDQMGNSEVGHITLGAGRIIYQDLPRISNAIANGSFDRNSELLQTIDAVRSSNSTLHLIGLTSSGGVHSHRDHGLAIIKLCKARGFSKVVWHAFLDGRDTPPCSAVEELSYIEEQLNLIGVGKIASLCGRFYAMDRDQRWERTAKAYHLLVHGMGRPWESALGTRAAIQSAYAAGETDEFVTPIVLTRGGYPISKIQSGDSVIFFNFRSDRARQITSALSQSDFHAFDRGPSPSLQRFLCFTSYDPQFHLPVIFPPQEIHHHLGEIIAEHHLRQFRVAETEKYAHVTFFFNGGREAPYPFEDRILIPSRRDVSTYEQAPTMSADKITEAVIGALSSQRYTFLLANFANPDMVGHTGNLPAAVIAVETIDQCLHSIVQAAQLYGTSLLITADHGNCEMMINPQTGQPHTAHTRHPVPFFLIDDRHQQAQLRSGAGLKDVAPTVLELMGLAKPQEMDGISLISKP